MRDLDLLVVGDCNPDLVLGRRRVRPAVRPGRDVGRAGRAGGRRHRARSPPAAPPAWACAPRSPGSSATTSSARFMRDRAAGARRRHRSERRRPGLPDGRLGGAGRAGRPGHAHVPRHDRRPAAGDGLGRAAPAGPSRPHRRLVPAGRPRRCWGTSCGARGRRGRRRRSTRAPIPTGRGTAASPSSTPEIDHLLPNAAEALALTGLARRRPRRPARWPRRAPAPSSSSAAREGVLAVRGRRARGGPGAGGRASSTRSAPATAPTPGGWPGC